MYVPTIPLPRPGPFLLLLLVCCTTGHGCVQAEGGSQKAHIA